MRESTQAKRAEPPMRALAVIVGLITFTLPVLVVVIGMHVDRSPQQPGDQRYAGLIQIVVWGSMLLAALVPSTLILTSMLSWARRIGLTIAVLCLLVLECVVAFYVALGSALR